MTQSSTWLDHRKRVVKCKVHGLHFDPKMTSGCALCRKEGLLPVEKQKPSFILLLSTVLLLTLVGMRLSGPFATALASMQVGGESEAPVRRPAPPAEVALDPEPYREVMVRLDGAVFTPASVSLSEMATRIVEGLAVLRQDVLGRRPDDGIAAAADLQALHDEIVPTAFDLATLDRVRTSWRALRRKHFQTAAWFQRPWTEPASFDPAAVALYDHVASELRGLAREGADEAAAARRRLLAKSDEHLRVEAWAEFQAGWADRVGALRQSLPQRPTTAPTQVLVGVQNLERAFDLASRVGPAAVPGDESFVALGEAAEAAQRAFETSTSGA